MNLIKYILLTVISCTVYSRECTPINVDDLSKELQIRQSQLQDAMDDCPNLINAINLALVFQQLDESVVAEEVMLDALNDSVHNDIDRGIWLIGNINLALKAKNTCQASQNLNELNYITGYEKEYRQYRKELYASTKKEVLNSKTIGCALAESRSVSFRGMKIKPKIDLAIHFDFNSDKLTEKGRQQSQQLASALNKGKLKNKTLLLVGHTDSVGTDNYNLNLSQRRSQSVKNFLVNIDSSFNNRIKTKGMGESQLLSQGMTDIDHQLNRRVEIQLQ